MQCRISPWSNRKNGVRCRVYSCPDRKTIECVKHAWWKALAFPDAATRVSVVCGKRCREEEIEMKNIAGGRPAREFRRRSKQ